MISLHAFGVQVEQDCSRLPMRENGVMVVWATTAGKESRAVLRHWKETPWLCI